MFTELVDHDQTIAGEDVSVVPLAAQLASSAPVAGRGQVYHDDVQGQTSPVPQLHRPAHSDQMVAGVSALLGICKKQKHAWKKPERIKSGSGIFGIVVIVEYLREKG